METKKHGWEIAAPWFLTQSLTSSSFAYPQLALGDQMLIPPWEFQRQARFNVFLQSDPFWPLEGSLLLDPGCQESKGISRRRVPGFGDRLVTLSSQKCKRPCSVWDLLVHKRLQMPLTDEDGRTEPSVPSESHRSKPSGRAPLWHRLGKLSIRSDEHIL